MDALLLFYLVTHGDTWLAWIFYIFFTMNVECIPHPSRKAFLCPNNIYDLLTGFGIVVTTQAIIHSPAITRSSWVQIWAKLEAYGVYSLVN